MRRSAVLGVSLALHGALAVALFALGPPRRAPARTATAIALTTLAPAPPPVAAPPMRRDGGGGGGPGRPASRRSPPRAATRAQPTRAQPTRAQPTRAQPTPTPTPVEPAIAPTPAAIGPSEAPAAAPEQIVGDAGPGAGGAGGGGAGGDGTGAGGVGPGGPGTGRAASPPPPPAPPRTVVRRSKARPARLIWPTRQADEDRGALVVLLVTVDDDGFVVGVRLRRGNSRRHDERAQDAAWKFRYDPARDDDGRPIASKVEQPVVVL